MEGAAEMAAKEQRLSLHVDVGGIVGEGGNLVGEEDGRRVEMLAHAVTHHSPQLLHLFFPHSVRRRGTYHGSVDQLSVDGLGF